MVTPEKPKGKRPSPAKSWTLTSQPKKQAVRAKLKESPLAKMEAALQELADKGTMEYLSSWKAECTRNHNKTLYFFAVVGVYKAFCPETTIVDIGETTTSKLLRRIPEPNLQLQGS